MVYKTIRKAKRYLGRVLLGRNHIEQMTKDEIEARIWELQNQRDSIKKEKDDLKEKFDKVVQKAKNASEDEVRELKTEASTLLSKYKVKRYQWSKIHAGLNYFEQAALHKDTQVGGISGLPTEANPEGIKAATRKWKKQLEKDQEMAWDINRGAKEMEEVHDGGDLTMDNMADGQASDIIDAAREGQDVPTINDLADEAYASSESQSTNDEDEDPMAAGMNGFPGE